MKIEELPHIHIIRKEIGRKSMESHWYPMNRKALMKKNGYVPNFDAMSDSYNIISRLLDKDCVVAYFTDNSQTTFLIKTRVQYVGFVCMSEKMAKCLSSHTTRRITRITDWIDKNGFMSISNGEDVIIADEDKWDKYLKTKLLESLSNG